MQESLRNTHSVSGVTANGVTETPLASRTGTQQQNDDCTVVNYRRRPAAAASLGAVDPRRIKRPATLPVSLSDPIRPPSSSSHHPSSIPLVQDKVVPLSESCSRSSSASAASRQKPSSSSDSEAPQRPPPEDLFQFLCQIPNESLFENLFRDSAVVQSVFRSLSDVERIFIMRLLHLNESIRWAPFVVWFGNSAKRAVDVLNNLRKRRILRITCGDTVSRSSSSKAPSSASSTVSTSSRVLGDASDCDSEATSGVSSTSRRLVPSRSPQSGSGGGFAGAFGTNSKMDTKYSLHPAFQETLIKCLQPETGGVPLSRVLSPPSKTPSHTPTVTELHLHSKAQWENLLRWMVKDNVTVKYRSSTAGDQPASADVEERTFAEQSLVVEAPIATAAAAASRCAADSRQFRMTGEQRPFRPPCPDVENIFQRLRLIYPNHAVSSFGKISSEAFQWLLKDSRRQLNQLCVAALQLVEHRANAGQFTSSFSDPNIANSIEHARIVDAVVFFFSLSQAKIGQPCSTKFLNPVQRRYLRLAWDLGLVWMRNCDESTHFFPTPFCLFLLSQSNCEILMSGTAKANWTPRHHSVLPSLVQDAQNSPAGSLDDKFPLGLPIDLYHRLYTDPLRRIANSPSEEALTVTKSDVLEAGIIVESNFRVFAYTASPLLISILSHLCELRMISPVIVVAALTRDSVLSAYKAGTSSEQVLRFLSSHAHPMVVSRSLRTGKAVVPDDVAIQLRMWESDRCRIRVSKCSLFQFTGEEDVAIFPQCVARASVGWCLTHSPVPKNQNPSSPEFENWKKEIIEKMRSGRSTQLDTPQSQSVAPILVVHSAYREDMSTFIRYALTKPQQQPTTRPAKSAAPEKALTAPITLRRRS